jgi:rhodanese-related sulfurtransferase
MAVLAAAALAVAGIGAGGCGREGEAPGRSAAESSGGGRAAEVPATEPGRSPGSAESGGGAAAPVVRAPKSDGDVLLIGVEEVRDKLAGGAPILVLDARSPRDFETEHIPGAVNVPLQKIAAAGQLPGVPRDYEIVVYCIAESCPISKNAARALARLGYTNVKDMRSGLVGWKEAGFATVSETRGAAGASGG